MQLKNGEQKGLGVYVQGMEEVAQSLLLLLQTPLGSMAGRPNYGINVLQYLSQSFSEKLRVEFTQEIYQAVSQWEKRVSILRMDMEPVNVQGGLMITLYWSCSLEEQKNMYQLEVQW